MPKFSVTNPRKMYWSNDVGGIKFCPDCRSALVEDAHPYLMVLRQGHESKSFIAGSAGGYFCAVCPVVVLDNRRFDSYASGALIGHTKADIRYAVIGIIDLSAIPEDKKHMALGEDDNPVPLVEFLPHSPLRGGHKKRSLKRRLP